MKKCIIRSTKIIKNIKSWELFNTDFFDKNISKKSNILYKFDDSVLTEYAESIKLEGQGIITNNYIITNRHVIGSKDDITCYYEENKNLITIKNIEFIGEIFGYDICILKIIDPIKRDDIKLDIKLDINFCNYDEINNTTKLYYETIELNTEKNKFSKILNKLDFLQYNMIYITSAMYPKIEVIEAISGDILKGGISGGLVTNENKKPIGIITLNIEKKNIIIPFYIINILLKNQFNKYPKAIKFNIDVCEPEDDTEYKYCLVITNEIKTTLISEKTRSFEKNDVICMIDDLYITENGTIKTDICKLDMDISTYMNLKPENNIDIKYCRNDNDIIKKETFLINEITDDYMSIRRYNTHNYFIYKGLIFAELSEEIIRYFSLYFKKRGYILSGQYVNDYNKYIIKKRFIILIGLIKKNIHESIKILLSDIELPFPIDKKDRTVRFTILRRIGNKNINNIEELSESFSDDNSQIYNFCFDIGGRDEIKLIL